MSGPSFDEQLAIYEGRTGSAIKENVPTVTAAGGGAELHQWVRSTHPRSGESLFYRVHRAGMSGRKHDWTPIRTDVSVTPEMIDSFMGIIDEDWKRAVDEFDRAQKVRSWRRDD